MSERSRRRNSGKCDCERMVREMLLALKMTEEDESKNGGEDREGGLLLLISRFSRV